MAKLQIGMIGCGGMMGAHAYGIEKMDEIEVIAVADPVKERRDAMASRFNGARAYKDHNDFFNGESKLDALFIAVPPAEHKGIEEEAIARKWNFKVEKPMSLNPAQAKRIAQDSQKAGLVTAVGFQDRYMEITDLMKDELKNTDIALIHATWAGGTPGVDWWRKKATCGGQLLEQNIHLVDLIRYLFGDYESVFAHKTKGIVTDSDFPGYDVEDSSTAVFKLKSGATATVFSACYLIGGGTYYDSGITALGRQKTLVYTLREKFRVVTEGSEKLYKQRNDQIVDSNIAYFEAVRKADPTAVRSPYGDALKSLEACFAANESMDTGKVVMI